MLDYPNRLGYIYIIEAAITPPITTEDEMNTAPQDIKDHYSRENNKGNGVGIGDDDMTIEQAIKAEGWTLDESFLDSLATASDSRGNRYIIGGDGSRRNAWAVSAD